MKRSAVVFVNGKSLKDVVPVRASDLEKALSSFAPGSKVVMVLKSYYRTRTLSQNNVFYAYCTYISNETGLSRTEVQNAMRNEYGIKTQKLDRNGNPEFDENGNALFVNKNLSDYNVSEMSEFLDKIHGAMIDDFGISMPPPKSYAEINFEI